MKFKNLSVDYQCVNELFLLKKKMKSASGHPVEATPQVVLYACCWVIGLCMSGEESD